ncbi:SAM-dependent chlorinase/fluorinase [Natronolimnohabitans sp. A-GB9]|uniref:SAM hydrolase/SAM-dependent halogenase family protein n=1 Tax=Natronolimnohabitans sp. A-GB9 TaxID=3069757 RepID=UPI0027B1BEE1|nr:SAM-dependent chlorinase/fluorinase [Natronolimnohabitans sp. A-GB9]MDQ2049877.1 SAM-dependent chlorinase/fluorinase [Natronolimnohabitans sp. A-GB9]
MITLASDFGTPYPAAMKGVLCQRTDARLVDVAHDFPRQDVRAAAFWLREVLPYFPPATHLVVIDPGVGTDRNALVVRAGEHTLVGPDNGVLLPTARRLAGDADPETYVVDETRLEPVEPAGAETDASSAAVLQSATPGSGPASATFHGRDVFAPAAAAVHEAGLEALDDLEWLDPLADDPVDCRLPAATLEDGDDGTRAVGEVLVVDDFGNVITNVPGGFLSDHDRIVANEETVPVGETFAAVPTGDRLATVGSHGYVELDVNQGRGDEAFGLEAGDHVCLASIP